MSHAIKPFTSDGCSGGMSWLWNKLFGHPPEWENECFLHDIKYWIGGSAKDRQNADLGLYIGVVNSGHPHIAFLMYIAVRIGGSAYLPLPWRWGYGHGYLKRTYAELNDFERAALHQLCDAKEIDLNCIIKK